MTRYYHLYDTKRDTYIKKSMNYERSEFELMIDDYFFLVNKYGRNIIITISKDYIVWGED